MRTASQYKRLTAFMIGSVGLFVLPFITDIYFKSLYIVGCILFIPLAIFRIIKDEKFEQRFFKRWHKARENGYWKNVISEGVRSLIIMLGVISLTQFFVYGRTPQKIMTELPIYILFGLMVFLLLLNFFAGMALWFENEKRYERLKMKWRGD